MSRDTGNITSRFRAFIPRHPANILGLPAEGNILLQKHRQSKTLSVQATKVHTGSGGTATQGFVCLFVYTTTHCSLKAYCAILVRRSNFRYQASPRLSPRESTQRRKVELWARNVQEFCLNVDSHVTFRDLLHAVKLRHGNDGFTSPPKEGVLRIFSP